MAIRVTAVSLYALHTGKTSFTGYVDGKYDHDYLAFDGFVDSTCVVEIGVTLENAIASGSYFLAGFEEVEGTAAAGYYGVEAYDQIENVVANGVYSIEAFVQQDGGGTASYSLNAFIVYDGKHDGHYDLSAYAPEQQVFVSEYELQVYLLAQGFADGLYDVEAYVDLLMQAVSSYDLNVFEGRENIAAQGNYDLNAWEAREVAVAAHYALLTFVQSTGYLTAEYALEAYEAFEEHYGVHYAINAHELLQGFADASYNINVLTLAQLEEGGHYSLDVYQALNGFVDATAVLNAYQQAQGFTDGQYGISIYLAKDGFVDAEYAIEALAAFTGYVDGTYLLDTTQELFTWVINHNTGAPSRYENFDFDSFAKIGEDYLAARGDGIYLLEGDDDNGIDIDAIATIGRTDFDEPSMKRVTAAFLGLNSAGQAHLTLRTDQGVTSGPYKLRQSATASTTERAKFARGLKSRYWEIDIENADGGDLHIKTAELETIILGEKRRLKK
jgi:hypothetical protein